MLISDNFPVRKSYFDSNIITRILRRFFLRIILKRTSTEALVYMRCHQGATVKHFDVSNVIYHKFSHGAVFYTLNGKFVNIMLELVVFLFLRYYLTAYRIAHLTLLCPSHQKNFVVKLKREMPTPPQTPPSR